MGHVYADVRLSDPEQKHVKQMKMLVDTGATHLCIDESIAKDLDLPVLTEELLEIADGRKVRAKASVSWIEINKRKALVQVRIFDVSEPVIGAFTLEALGLQVDPASGELKQTRSFITRG